MDDLVERLARGEDEAFAELYDACADRLHHYLTVRMAHFPRICEASSTKNSRDMIACKGSSGA